MRVLSTLRLQNERYLQETNVIEHPSSWSYSVKIENVQVIMGLNTRGVRSSTERESILPTHN